MRVVAVIADIIISLAFLAIYAVAGVGVFSSYPELRTLGMLLGVAFAVFMTIKYCNVSSYIRAYSSLVGEPEWRAIKVLLVMAVKEALPALGLSAAWMIGIMGIPVLNWIPLVFLIYMATTKSVIVSDDKESGFKAWLRSKVLEIRQLKTWDVVWQVSLVAVVAQLLGHYFGSPFVTAAIFAICAPCAVNRLLIKNEIASLMRVNEVVATGKLKAMESAYKSLDKEKLPKSEKALKEALQPIRAAAALALNIAARNPNTRYYTSIFRAAAKNVLDGQYGIKFQFKDLGTEPAIFKNLDETFNFEKVADYVSSSPCKPREPLVNASYKYFQSDSDYKHYDIGLTKIISVMNAIVGENVFKESSEGLSIIAERGCYNDSKFGYIGTSTKTGEELYVQPVTIRICLECDYSKYTGYVVVSRSFARAPSLPTMTAMQKAAQDLAIFYSKTLGIPYEAITTKNAEKHSSKVSALMDKVKELVIDELKGQIEDAVIQTVADQFFDENADLVADLIGECMKDRASEEIADLIADVIVGQVADAAIGFLGELVNS